MTKFFWVSILLNVIGIVLLYVFLILPHWYFGLSRRPQLIMEISLVMMVISQILVAIVCNKRWFKCENPSQNHPKFKGNEPQNLGFISHSTT